MRGKLLISAGTTGTGGITPAHAGKTNRRFDVIACVEDHPRACGENIKQIALNALALGSPPRMRGKLPWSRLCRPLSRITPAHAGKTYIDGWHKKNEKDHPRACGENILSLTLMPNGLGSPPRMRGKPAPQSKLLPRVRITPAHAGKTAVIHAAAKTSTDHPRACGENFLPFRGFSPRQGSPPRMRGKRISASAGAA